MGTIRGAQIAVGEKGRVHVVWNPSQKSGLHGMQYARMKDDGSGFESQRSVSEEYSSVDGGGSIAADEQGNVFIAWHAPKNKIGKETDRRALLARSTDEGKTFSDPIAVDDRNGVCACCGIAVFEDSAGGVHLLYRAAREMVNRGMYLLA